MQKYYVFSVELRQQEVSHTKAVYLATEVNARIAELEKSHARYEKLRRLDPRQFHSLWMQNIATGEKFDDLVDRLP